MYARDEVLSENIRAALLSKEHYFALDVSARFPERIRRL
jgi:hypothetical protein